MIAQLLEKAYENIVKTIEEGKKNQYHLTVDDYGV